MLRKLFTNTVGRLGQFNFRFGWGASTFSDGAQRNTSRNKNNAVLSRGIMEELPSFSRREMVSFCRYLDQNLSYVSGTFGSIVNFTVRNGFTPEFYGGDKTWQDEQKSAFLEWCKRATADGRNDLTTELKVITRAWLRDGEVFVVYTFDGDGRPCLQTLETHVFSDSYGYNQTRLDGYIDGVSYSDTGKAIGYATFAGETIQAASVVHVCEPLRAGQLRVAPSWGCAINNLFDVKELDQLAKTGFKMQLLIPTVVARAGGGTSPRERTYGSKTAPTTTDTSDDSFEKATGVVIKEIDAGGTITQMRPEYPGPLYTVFKESFLRDFHVGVQWPYDFVSLSSLNGTQQRTVIEMAKVRAEVIQDTIQWPVYRRAMIHWLSWRIKTGQTAAASNWWKVGYRKPRDMSIDLGRDTKAIADEVGKALMGPDEYFSLYGQTAAEEFAKGAGTLGITVEQYRNLWILNNYGEKAAQMLGIKIQQDAPIPVA